MILGASEHRMDSMGLKAINTLPCVPKNFCQGSEIVPYIGAHLRYPGLIFLSPVSLFQFHPLAVPGETEIPFVTATF